MVGPNHCLFEKSKNKALIVKNDDAPEMMMNISNFLCNELKVLNLL